jgi:hypothetical protein
MFIFNIIKNIIITIITPPKAGNIRKLVKTPKEPLEEPLIESNQEEDQIIKEKEEEKEETK